MGTCPLCDEAVDQLHPLPPEVITKELLDDIGVSEGTVDIDLCAGCIHDLMEAG